QPLHFFMQHYANVCANLNFKGVQRMKRRKGLSLMMGLLLVASLLFAGCGPQEEGDAQSGGSEEKPEKLVVWANNDPVQLKNTRKLAQEYEKKTGIKVEVVPVDLLKQQEKLGLDGPAGKGEIGRASGREGGGIAAREGG